MKRCQRGLLAVLLLTCLLGSSWSFERRSSAFFHKQQPAQRSSTVQYVAPAPMSPQEEEPNEPENNNNNNNKEVEESESMRRNVILGSAAVLSSALLGVLVPNYSQAAANAATAANTAYGLDDAETRRIDIFEKTAPSVVFIDTFTEKQDQFSTNAIDVPLGTGTGFVWDKQGHIVTNYHVVRNSKVAQVALITPTKGKYSLTDPLFPPTKQVSEEQPLPPLADVFPFLSGTSSTTSSSSTSSSSTILPYSSMRPSNDSTQYRRKVYKATVVGVDPGKDVAVLKIDAPIQELFPINVGTSTGLRVGQGALAIGNPFGLDHTLTSGIISGIGREVKSPIGRPISNVIQTDAAINPGNSGGPLLDSSGKLIGMNTAIYSTSGASAGIGFAIPIDTVKFIVNTLIKDGKVVRPVLGIAFLESKQARALGIGRGVLVLEVPPDSPAAKAGLKGTRRTETGLLEIGDIITMVGDRPINTEADLFQALEDCKPGDKVKVKVTRIESVNDTLSQKEVTLEIELQSSESIPASLGNTTPYGTPYRAPQPQKYYH